MYMSACAYARITSPQSYNIFRKFANFLTFIALFLQNCVPFLALIRFFLYLCIVNTQLKRILNILLVVAAYGYLGYKIVTYDNYAGLLQQFRQAELWQWLCLVACFLLFPFNRFFEAWKWQYLVRHIEPMNLWEAQRQVYYGTIAGFVTPYKIGEYPGRALLFRNTGGHWLTATCLGLIGGYAMTTIIVVAGLPTAIYWLSPDSSLIWSMLLTIAGALLAIIALPALMRRLQNRTYRSEQTGMLVRSIARLRIRDVLILLWMSLLRYVCFIVQLTLVLLFCGVLLDPLSMIITQPLYYLMITVTPNIPAAEIAVRGAWAVAIFDRFGADISAAAVVASLLLWAINTIFPLLVGSLVGKPQNKQDATEEKREEEI